MNKTIFTFILLVLLANKIYAQIYVHTHEVNHNFILSGDSLEVEYSGCAYGYGTPNAIIERTISIKLDVGEDYEYGTNNFEVKIDSLEVIIQQSVNIKLYDILSLKINEEQPEIIKEIGTFSVFSSLALALPYKIKIKFAQYSCSNLVENAVRFTLIVTEKYKVAPPTQSPSVKLLESEHLNGNKYKFSWTKLDDLGYKFNTGHYQFQILKLYNKDSTHISTPEDIICDIDWSKALDLELTSLKRELILNLVEGSGYYVWRVRQIGTYYEGGITNALNYGGWSATGTNIYNGATNVPITSEETPYLFYHNQAEEDINWIYNRVFSEEVENDSINNGIKIGESIVYTNGLQQVVQNQTYINTYDTVLAKATIYDYSGRPALNTLPVPIEKNYFKYQENFILDLENNQEYTALYFDSTGNYNNPSAVESQNSLMNYYSNNDTNDLYVPDAELYPFSRTLYYSGSGKIKEIGSYGQTHRIKPDGTGKTIKKIYSGVADPELIKIFGTEAPDASLVTKEINIDQNNVVNVSYIDHTGKILATCLAADPDFNTSLSHLDSYSNNTNIITFSANNNTQTGNIITSGVQVYVFDTIDVKFHYDITPAEISDFCIDYCSTCDQIVRIFIKNLSNDSIMFERIDTISPQTCSNPDYNNQMLDTIITGLTPGDYQMFKEVYVSTVNPETQILYLEEHLDSLQEMYNQAYSDMMDTLYPFINANDLYGFYNAISHDIDTILYNPEEYYEDSMLHLTYANCKQIDVPIYICPTSPCYWGTDSIYLFTEYLQETLAGTGYLDQDAGEHLNATNYIYTIDAIQILLENMINDTAGYYNCEDIWTTWQTTINTYINTVETYDNQNMLQPSLIDLFLDAIGRNIIDYVDLSAGDSESEIYNFDLLTNKYKVMTLDTTWNYKMVCAFSIIDTTLYDSYSYDSLLDAISTSIDIGYNNYIVHYTMYNDYLIRDSIYNPITGDSIADPMTSQTIWTSFYQCVNSIDTLLNVEDPVEICEQRCEDRKPVIIDKLYQLHYANGMFVEGDEYVAVADTLWSNPPYYTYDYNTPLSDPSAYNVSKQQIECYSDAIIDNCKDYCRLTFLTDNITGDTIGLGTDEEIANLTQAMLSDFEIDFFPQADNTWTGDYDTINTLGIYSEPLYSYSEYSTTHALINDSIDFIWDRIFGGDENENPKQIIRTSDGGWLIAGTVDQDSDNGSGGNMTDLTQGYNRDIWVIKLDSAANKKWDNKIIGNNYDNAAGIIETDDGHYLICGTSNSSNTQGFEKTAENIGGTDFWVVKVNSTNGTNLWDKTYGTAKYDELIDVVKLSDGNIILAGTYNDAISHLDYYIIKINQNGDTLWTKTYGTNDRDILTSITETYDHNIVIAGYTNAGISGDKTEPARGGADFWIIKLKSTTGKKIWDKTIGGHSNEIYPAIIEDKNNNLVITGISTGNYTPSNEHLDAPYALDNKYDLWVIKLDAYGNRIWDRNFGSYTSNNYKKSPKIIETKAGRYLIGSTSYTITSNSDATDTKIYTRELAGNYHTNWLVYTKPDGTFIWDRNIGGFQDLYDEFVSIIQQDDRRFTLLSNANNKIYYEKTDTVYHKDDNWAINFCYKCPEMELVFRWKDRINTDGALPDTSFENNTTCEQMNMQLIVDYIRGQKEQFVEEKLQEFEENYSHKCLLKSGINDNYTAEYSLNYYHYTLYYYDRAGNLIKTVPPEGVKPLLNNILSRNDTTTHRMVSKYEYNSIKQLVKQYTPDGGYTEFFYNNVGQLRFSVNAQQRADKTFSYTKYDALNRTIEVGVADSTEDYIANIEDLTYPLTGTSQQTYFVYTDKHPYIKGIESEEQDYILNRVSYTYSITSQNDTVYTVYSYDPHGNVKWLAQQLPELGLQYIYYQYDLLSGNVTKVSYNPGRTDQFYHRYKYDSDNRIILAETSIDNVIWDKDAKYQYYLHGPLKRTEIGEDKIQGLDYTYTIQGWLKALNNPKIDSLYDPGQDGYNNHFASDIYSQSLSYYSGDYSRSGAFGGDNQPLQATNIANLYNGNIAAQTTNYSSHETIIGESFENINKATSFNYQYDELNRLKSANFSIYDNSSFSSSQKYLSNFSYDANGNLTQLSRKNNTGTIIDDFKYTYKSINSEKINNRLIKLEDTGTSGNNDFNAGIAVYEYDSIGNLIRNENEKIDIIKWNVYGKISEIIKTSGANSPNLRFAYDASGNRVIKEVIWPTYPENNTTTYYVRDAQGNIMAIYEKTSDNNTNSYNLIEQPIYGSDRIGVRKTKILVKQTENQQTLVNNVLETIKSEHENQILSFYSIPPLSIIPLAHERNFITSYFNITPIIIPVYLSSIKLRNHNSISHQVNDIHYYTRGTTPNVAICENSKYKHKITALSYIDNAGNKKCRIFDNDNNFILNSYLVNTDPAANSIIIETSQDSKKYLLFTYKSGKLYSSVINTNLNLPAVTSSNQIGTDVNYQKQFTVFADYTRNKALYSAKYISDKIHLYTHQINDTIVSQEQQVAQFRSSGLKLQMQISPDGNYLAISHLLSGNGFGIHDTTEIRFYYIKDDRSQIEFADSIIMPGETINSFDFTEKNTYICYSGMLNGDDYKIKRINLQTKDIDTLHINNQISTVVRGKDNSIYYGVRNDNKLYRIENPESDYTLNFTTINNISTWRYSGNIPQQAHCVYQYAPEYYVREIGNKNYQISNHLGNVTATFRDIKEPFDVNNLAAGFYAKITSLNDYYAFGSLLNGRNYSSDFYRYGFNGMLKDDEIFNSTGTSYTAEFWQYDTRTARRWNLDPVKKEWESPYLTFSGNPIYLIDPFGNNAGWYVDNESGEIIGRDKNDDDNLYVVQDNKDKQKILDDNFKNGIDQSDLSNEVVRIPTYDKRQKQKIISDYGKKDNSYEYGQILNNSSFGVYGWKNYKGDNVFEKGDGKGDINFRNNKLIIGIGKEKSSYKTTQYNFISHTHNYKTSEIFPKENKPRLKVPSKTDLKLPLNTSGQVFDWENNKVYIFNSNQKNSVKMSMDIYFKPFNYKGNEY